MDKGDPVFSGCPAKNQALFRSVRKESLKVFPMLQRKRLQVFDDIPVLLPDSMP